MAKATNSAVLKAEEMGKKWHGELKEIINAPANKAWLIAGDFCSLHKWLNTVELCEKIEGEHQQPGCVRFVAGNSFPRPDGSKSWAHEKLLSMDADNHSFSYAMVDGNFGFDGYVSCFKLQDLGNGTSLVDWSFEVNPLENRTEEAVAQFMTTAFRRALSRLEELVNSPAT